MRLEVWRGIWISGEHEEDLLSRDEGAVFGELVPGMWLNMWVFDTPYAGQDTSPALGRYLHQSQILTELMTKQGIECLEARSK